MGEGGKGGDCWAALLDTDYAVCDFGGVDLITDMCCGCIAAGEWPSVEDRYIA